MITRKGSFNQGWELKPGQEINAGHRTMSGNNEQMSGRNIFLLDIIWPYLVNFLRVKNFVFIYPLFVHMTSKWKIERDFGVIYTGLLVTLEGGSYIHVKNVQTSRR